MNTRMELLRAMLAIEEAYWAPRFLQHEHETGRPLSANLFAGAPGYFEGAEAEYRNRASFVRTILIARADSYGNLNLANPLAALAGGQWDRPAPHFAAGASFFLSRAVRRLVVAGYHLARLVFFAGRGF